jgi:hypothetical protein
MLKGNLRMCISHEATGYIRAVFNLGGYWRRSHLKPHLKPCWGKPAARNFRGGGGNRVMVNLNGHEAGNGGYRQGEPKATTPLLYSTLFIPLVCIIFHLIRTVRLSQNTKIYLNSYCIYD